MSFASSKKLNFKAFGMNWVGRSTVIICLIFPAYLSAFQEQKVVAWIDKAPVYSGEFLYAFNKNRDTDQPINEDSLFNYLDQYVNFKLKVLAAELTGIDTTKKFKDEYITYADEIKKPYLQNPNFEEYLIQEAYERLQFEVRAAHILVRIPKNASPSDTLLAFNQISALRKRAFDGEPFAELAKKNSQDGSAQVGGDLGYFTGFSMVYPFENAAYKTKVGDVSQVVRSQFGYHIVKVLDRRTARGRVKTAHIFINSSDKSDVKAKELINMAYDSLQNGGDWRAICSTYSEDTRTKLSGGSLPFYGVGQLPEPLLNAAFGLNKTGEIGEPVQSRFGWHILKLEARESVKSLSEIRGDVANRVKRSGRNQLDKKGLLKKLKSENGFQQDTSLINSTIRKVRQAVKTWPETNDEQLFSIGDHAVLDSDLISHLNKTYPAPSSVSPSIWQIYEQFEFDQITFYEDQLIPQKYPEHQYLINEYKQGLLLFEIMEEQIWNKAIEDSTGLNSFYTNNLKRYSAPERAEVVTVSSDSMSVLEAVKTLIDESKEQIPIIKFLNDHMDPKSYSLLKIVKRRFEQNELPIFARTSWKSGTLISEPGLSKLYWIEEIIPPGYHDLEDIKGLVISDYQDFLEQQWIKKLRDRHKVKINKKSIKAIASNLE